VEVVKGNQVNISLDTGLDLSQHTVLEIGYVDPNRESGVDTATDDGNGILSLSKVFDIEGYWTIWSVVDGFLGEPTILTVYDVPEQDTQIVTLPFVKRYLNIETNKHDFKILALIPIVEHDYERIQNAPFVIYYDEDYFGYYKVFPQGASVIAAEMIGFKLFGRDPSDGYKDVSSERVGSYSVSYSNMAVGYPRSITSSIKRFTRLVP